MNELNLRPSLDELNAYSGSASHVVFAMSMVADTLTPISAFARIQHHLGGGSFLFESVEGGEVMGRWSFMGAGLHEAVRFSDHRAQVRNSDGALGTQRFDDPLDLIRDAVATMGVWSPTDLPRFFGGLVGWLGFDCVRYFEGTDLPHSRGVDQPEGRMLLADVVVGYDHLRHRVTLMTCVPLASNDRLTTWTEADERLRRLAGHLQSHVELPPISSPEVGEVPDLAFQANRTAADMERAVIAAKEAIMDGEIFQVVLSQRLTAQVKVHPLAVYRRLRALNPSPYMFMLRFDDVAIVGASPEVLVRCEAGEILVRPIAGTRPRGRHAGEDDALAEELQADPKELAEHRMLLDLGRNDVGRVAVPGSVRVEEPLHIERYSHVMHIVSTVKGKLAAGLDCFDVFRACFPAGTVSGAPKVRACELISQLEPDRRGVYAGAVGYFGYGGEMDTCIAIRTLVIEEEAVHAQAGAGVVMDSDPRAEHLECLHKARAGLRAVAATVRDRAVAGLAMEAGHE